MVRLTICGIVVVACLAACAPVGLMPPPATPTQTNPPTGAAPTPTATIPIAPARALALWVAPEFSSDGPGEAAALLGERLLEFEASHPGVRIEVRIKGRSGPAGLMAALAAAQQAAPSVLPDLVALDMFDLGVARAAGLVATWEESGATPETWGWIAAAVGGAQVDGMLIGLPFAAQADVFAFRPVAYPTPPLSWADTLTGSGSFLFPAGDPRSEFTLAQYLSAGGSLRDTEGNPALDPQVLQDVLEFYAAARAGGLLPLSSRQHEDSSTTINALTSAQVGASVVPFDRLDELVPADIQVVGPWPSRDGRGTCFMAPWSWAVVNRPPAPDPLAIELATWLARPEFAGPWTRALNLLPATSAALALWPADSLHTLAETLSSACLPLPSPEDLDLFGPALRDAIGATLTGERTPEEAAAAAAASIASP